MNRKVVLGIGNILNSDEGLGVHALKQLQEEVANQTPDVEYLDGGVLGLNLLLVVEECSHLLVLDAIDARQTPGTVIELRREDIPLYTNVKMSQHQVTFQEVLGLANMRDKLPPQLHMVGIQPASLAIGTTMSDTVATAIPTMIARAVAVLEAWNLRLK
jgi:hydrogenase maturation protease